MRNSVWYFSGKPFVLAVCFKNGEILLMRTYDDIIPQVIMSEPGI